MAKELEGKMTDMSFMAKALKTVQSTINNVSDIWFSPQNPIPPIVPEEKAVAQGVKGRAFDYPVGFNLRIQPRGEEPVSFQQMRDLADGYDLLRAVIETKKDKLCRVPWEIRYKDEKKEADARVKEVHDFFMFPDKEHDWQDWLRMVLEDMLVIDAPTIYLRRTKGGKPYSLDVIDGATIKRVIDGTGRTPMAPAPAYQQILKGVPATDYSAQELVYKPRNIRPQKLYGYSPVEQIMMTVNIALRRQINQLQYYTEGNTPDLIFSCPPEWQTPQVKEFQEYWEYLINTTASRRKAKFVPSGVTPHNTKEHAMKDEYDEWLARIVCYAFSVPNTAFIRTVNRAVAENAQVQSEMDGDVPTKLWIKSLINTLIFRTFGYTDIEFAWPDESNVDPEIRAKVDQIYLQEGVISIDEVRKKIGYAGAAPGKPVENGVTGNSGTATKPAVKSSNATPEIENDDQR
jgi:hypothetical protein